jgi:hypothetical protein
MNKCREIENFQIKSLFILRQFRMEVVLFLPKPHLTTKTWSISAKNTPFMLLFFVKKV